MTSIALGDLFTGSSFSPIARKHVPVWGGSRYIDQLPVPVPKPGEWIPRWMRAFRRTTAALFARREKGRHGGIIGAHHKAVIEALVFRCRDPETDVIDKAVATIASWAQTSVSATFAILAELRAWGIIDWANTCSRDANNQLQQETNRYTLRPPDQWLYQPPPDAPPPDAHGAPEHVPDAFEAAAQAADSGDHKAVVTALEWEPPGNKLISALNQLGKAVDGKPVPDHAPPDADAMPEPPPPALGDWTRAGHTAAVEAQEARHNASIAASERRFAAAWNARRDAQKQSKA